MSSVAANPAAPMTLRRQFSWTLPANVLYGACSFLTFVVLNKFGNPGIAGDYTLALATIAPVFMCINLRFSTMLASDTRSTVHVADYFRLRGYLVASALVLVLVLVAGFLVARGQSELAMLIVFVSLAKSAEAFSDLCCGVQQRVERMDRIAISLAANGLVMVFAFAATYYLTRNLTYAVIGLFVSRLTVLVGYDIPVARKAANQRIFSDVEGRQGQAYTRMRRLLFSAAPLGITAALISLTANIPRYVIPVVFDREMLGLFASLAVTLQAGGLIFRAIELPAIPRLAHLFHQGNARGLWLLLGKLCGLFITFGIAGALASLVIGPQVLTWVYTDQYFALGGVLAMMALATSVGQIAGLIESSLIAARVIAVQVPMHCLTAASCLVLCLTLIPKYGLYGAVLAVTICRIPFMLIGVLLLRQKLRQPAETANFPSHNTGTSQASIDVVGREAA